MSRSGRRSIYLRFDSILKVRGDYHVEFGSIVKQIPTNELATSGGVINIPGWVFKALFRDQDLKTINKYIVKKHTKLYLDYFGFDIGDTIPCELTGAVAVDIHHIVPRGMGGRKSMDTIENLMATTRELHEIYGDKEAFKEFLKEAHRSYMETRQPYLEVNPNHEGFDILLNKANYGPQIKKLRQTHGK